VVASATPYHQAPPASQPAVLAQTGGRRLVVAILSPSSVKTPQLQWLLDRLSNGLTLVLIVRISSIEGYGSLDEGYVPSSVFGPGSGKLRFLLTCRMKMKISGASLLAYPLCF
jgi:hypothetical protein